MEPKTQVSTVQTYSLLLISIIPLLLAANSLRAAVILGIAYFMMLIVAILIVNLARFFPKPLLFFTIEVLLYALALSLVSSLIRIISPISFELMYPVLFLFPFTMPVLNILKEGTRPSDFEWIWKKITDGLFFLISILLTGSTRELLSNGSITLAANVAPQPTSFLPIFRQPSGFFLLLGFVFLITNSIMNRLGRSES